MNILNAEFHVGLVNNCVSCDHMVQALSQS